MSPKDAVLKAVSGLPVSATWAEITDALVNAATQYGTPADFARLYKTQVTSADLAEYADPTAHGPRIPLRDLVAELEAMPSSEPAA